MAFDLATHAVKDNELFEFLQQKDDEKRRGAFRAMDKRLLESQYKLGREQDKQLKAGRGVMRVSARAAPHRAPVPALLPRAHSRLPPCPPCRTHTPRQQRGLRCPL